MKQYRIGEFAKQMGVSIDFIRYYEEAGLIRSTQDPANHYHYYDFSQSKLIHLIQYFRTFGYSAQEIVLLLRQADAEQAAELFAAKARAHRQQALISAYSANQLEFIANAVRSEPNGAWYIVRLPAVYFLPHTNGEDYIQDPRTRETLKAWNQAAPFVYGVDRCIMKNDAHLIQHGRAILAEDARQQAIPLQPPVVYLPAVRCLEYYLDVAHSGSFDESPSLTIQAFKPALAIIEEKHFTIAGDMFIRFLSFFFKDGRQYEKNVLYIPIQM